MSAHGPWRPAGPAIAAILLLLAASCAGPERGAADGVADAGIDFYQRWLGPQWAYHCAMEPSCSAYGRQAFADYGPLPGALMTADRLMRDHGYAEHQYPRDEHGHPLDPPSDNALFAARESPSLQVSLRELAAQEEQAAREPRPGAAEDWLGLARELLEGGDAQAAGVEFRRALRGSEDPTLRRSARRGLVVALALQGRTAEAHLEAERLPPESREEMQAWLDYREGRLSRALDGALPPSPEGHTFRGMVALEAGAWEVARSEFGGLGDPLARHLLDETARMQELPSKSAWAAGTLSAVIPGAGQFYAGRRADGVVAFLTNAILIGATAAALHNDEEVTAGVVGFVALGFYAGNVYGGVNAARRHDHDQRQRFLRDLRGRLRREGPSWGLEPREDGAALGLYLRF